MASTKDASSPTGGSARSDSPTTAPKTSATPPLDIDVHEEPVEVDEQDDKDSSYAESVSSESYFTSLRSSIRDYKCVLIFLRFRSIPQLSASPAILALAHHPFFLLIDMKTAAAIMPSARAPTLCRTMKKSKTASTCCTTATYSSSTESCTERRCRQNSTGCSTSVQAPGSGPCISLTTIRRRRWWVRI